MAALWLTGSDGSRLMLSHHFAFFTDRSLACVCSGLCLMPEGNSMSALCIKSSHLQDKVICSVCQQYESETLLKPAVFTVYFQEGDMRSEKKRF